MNQEKMLLSCNRRYDRTCVDKIRPIGTADIPALQDLHQRSGLTYPFPFLGYGDGMVSKLALVDDSGKITAAALGKMTVETYLLLDMAASARRRWERICELSSWYELDLRQKGIDSAHAFIPPALEDFAGQIARLGWVKEPYMPYCKILEV